MSDQELIAELTAQARDLEESDGHVNPFLSREYELLTEAAQRIEQLTVNMRFALKARYWCGA
jgi:hypothetical protein